jgi:hypothetical protein
VLSIVEAPRLIFKLALRACSVSQADLLRNLQSAICDLQFAICDLKHPSCFAPTAPTSTVRLHQPFGCHYRLLTALLKDGDESGARRESTVADRLET